MGKSVERYDSVPLTKAEYTPEGFLIDTPIVSSIGIFEYHDKDGKPYRELRLPEHVFADESLATYEGKPIIITHNAGEVDKDNVEKFHVGTILSKGFQDGNNVRAKIVIHDIDKVKQSGMKELSLGYRVTLDETPGEWNGQPYDAIQTEIVINHLAIVSEARAGEQARLNIDSKNSSETQKGADDMANKKPMSEETKKSIAAFEARRKRRLDEAAEEAENNKTDNEISETETGGNADSESNVAEEIKESSDNPDNTPTSSVEERISNIRDRRDRRDAEGDPTDPETAKGIIAQQDEDIEQLLEIVEELQAAADVANVTATDSDCDTNSDEGENNENDKPINADSIDAIIAERLRLGKIGDRLNLDGLERMRPLDAKKAVIKKLKPSLRLDGKGSAYINTAFDIAVQEFEARKDTMRQRQQMFNADTKSAHGISKAQAARENMLNRLKNGGKE